MSDYITKRLRYFNGQFLEEKDFTTEQKYFLARRYEHNKLYHTPGIASGLTVSKSDNRRVQVKPGIAIDNLGHEIVLDDDKDVDVPAAIQKNVQIYVTIEYHEDKSEDKDEWQQSEDINFSTRWHEKPNVQIITTENLKPTMVPLAKFELNEFGIIADKTLVDDRIKTVGAVMASRSIAVGQFKTEIREENYTLSKPLETVTNKAQKDVLAYEARLDDADQSNKSRFLLVYTYIETPLEISIDNALTWEQLYTRKLKKEDNCYYNQQWVRFKTQSLEAIKFRYRIYTLFEA